MGQQPGGCCAASVDAERSTSAGQGLCGSGRSVAPFSAHLRPSLPKRWCKHLFTITYKPNFFSLRPSCSPEALSGGPIHVLPGCWPGAQPAASPCSPRGHAGAWRSALLRPRKRHALRWPKAAQSRCRNASVAARLCSSFPRDAILRAPRFRITPLFLLIAGTTGTSVPPPVPLWPCSMDLIFIPLIYLSIFLFMTVAT